MSNVDGDGYATILAPSFDIGVAYSFSAVFSTWLVLRDLWPDALLPLLTISIS